MNRSIVTASLATLVIASLPFSCIIQSSGDDDGGGGSTSSSGGDGGAGAQGGADGGGGDGGAGGSIPEPPPAPACVDEDLLFALGDMVAAGDTTMGSDDATPTCGFSGGNDVLMRWFAISAWCSIVNFMPAVRICAVLMVGSGPGPFVVNV